MRKHEAESVAQVRTSHQRHRFFGPYLYSVHQMCHWVSLGSPEQGPVNGLIVDMLARGKARFDSFGASFDAKGPAMTEERPPKVVIPTDLTGFTNRFGMATYFSHAALTDVRTLDIMMDASRCAGLYVTHLDGSCEVLGQWDPSKASREIYNVEAGPLRGITFHFSESDTRFSVQGIRAHTDEERDESGDGRYFSMQELGKVCDHQQAGTDAPPCNRDG